MYNFGFLVCTCKRNVFLSSMNPMLYSVVKVHSKDFSQLHAAESWCSEFKVAASSMLSGLPLFSLLHPALEVLCFLATKLTFASPCTLTKRL